MSGLPRFAESLMPCCDFMNAFDTIAAVSTPRGKGGIAVLRVSGEGTRALLARVFTPFGRMPQENPRYACFGQIHTPTGEAIDEGLVTFFAAPASFTGEDVAEISCHGGVLVTEAVLAAVLAAGARMAEAGEFTARAVMHGKMGLAAAESLCALLDAGTKGQLALARGGMSGRLADAAREIYTALTAILADVYAKIDFPDEDLASMSRGELRTALAAVYTRVQALAETWHTGRAVSEGIEAVICGPVNAGKSTLYNALVGHEAAIVTDIAGTTRDMLTETVSLGDVTLRLSDTAGLRETDDVVERMGVERADAAIVRAELVLAVLDAAAPRGAEVDAFLARLARAEGTVILVLNKQDKAPVGVNPYADCGYRTVAVSAKTGDISALSAALAEIYRTGECNLFRDPVVASARQFAALERARETLDGAITALDAGVPLDAVCVAVELAASAVGEVDGRAVGEDVVADIFSRFCVGK